ncbi:MAG: mltG [Oscillospiraceae bacterium]|jgi:UPF0755 protein|nr:mltG [Oscillospiraceae bacterium]
MKKYMIIVSIVLCFLLVSCSSAKKQDSSSKSTATSSNDTVSVSSIEYPVQSFEENFDISSKTSSKSPSSKAVTSSKKTTGNLSSSTVSQRETVKITIPEGYSVSQIGDALQAKGVCKKSDFLKQVNAYDFTYYPLVKKIPANSHRCYKLEGYLFPDTYEFYKNMKPQDAIGKMLRGAESKIGTNYSYSGMSTYEIITLASIIEKETPFDSEMKKISSVLHNRLKAGMKLQADPTIYYIERYVKPNLTGDINRYNAYYNTYKCAALPAGPICSPGESALYAAAHPEKTDYMYFVVDKKGKGYYAKTFEEHIKNCELAGIKVGSSQ